MGTVLDYNGDTQALFIANGGSALLEYEGNLLSYINQQLSANYTEINGAMAAYATFQGVYDWDSLNTLGIAGGHGPSLIQEAGGYILQESGGTILTE